MPTPETPRREIFIPLDGPPQVARPSPEIYAAMGEANIFRMIADFYRALGQSPVRHLFPGDMQVASERSAAFFVGLLGGPPLYQQRYGNPALRARHLPFRIDAAARETWLVCFESVLAQAPATYNFPAQHLEGFRTWLREFSRWMVNAKPE
jgi:hemoglobin